MHLNSIKSPSDLRKLPLSSLHDICNEIRQGILFRVSNQGGHLGPNLGFTEATVAIHYAFSTPEDKLVLDVSHQCYPHKMLTGRADGFFSVDDMSVISGYSSPSESPIYDTFEIGHTSTSISLATGLQKGRDITGGRENIIAVIGDGSLSGGEAFEGLNTAAALGTNIIIIVNDNEMSIAENHGGLYNNLSLLRQTKGQAQLNFFKTLGFDYYYLDEGNDVIKLVELFKSVKDIDHPVVLHIHTQKGHGYAPAVNHKEQFHWTLPFNETSGEIKSAENEASYAEQLGDWLIAEMQENPSLVVISAGVPGTLGFTAEKRLAMGRQYIDVGIAEEQAVALASGIARRGANPVFSTYATFLQRTYDQLAQDLAVNSNPAVVNVVGASLFGMNDYTHICFFDIPLFSHIPNLHYLAPSSIEELFAMERWAIKQDKYSVAIRVPEGEMVHADYPVFDDFSNTNHYQIIHKGKQVAIIPVGNMYARAVRVAEILRRYNIDPTIIHPHYISSTDTETLDALIEDHSIVVSIEDGSLCGGFGERISRHFGNTLVRTISFGIKKDLYDRYSVSQLLHDNHLTEPQIANDIIASLSQKK